MKIHKPTIAASFTLLCSLVFGKQSSYSNQLPVVDLGYELHQAASYNVSQMPRLARTFITNTYGMIANWKFLQLQ